MQRKPLKHRDYEVDLESRLGKTQVSFLIFLSKAVCTCVELVVVSITVLECYVW